MFEVNRLGQKQSHESDFASGARYRYAIIVQLYTVLGADGRSSYIAVFSICRVA